MAYNAIVALDLASMFLLISISLLRIGILEYIPIRKDSNEWE